MHRFVLTIKKSSGFEKENVELLAAPGTRERGADRGIEESISGLETDEGFSLIAGT